MPHNPHADFDPTLKPYTGQGAFRFWCQLALPLTFDDSLSYYELLNKVVIYLNNVIKDVSNVEENVESLNNAYNELQNYVNTYFDSLDLQAEINRKLDEMAYDGSLGELLEPYLPDIVSDWLEENVIIPEGGAVTLDPTLSDPNQAAQAKSVGENTFTLRHSNDINLSGVSDLNNVKIPGTYYKASGDESIANQPTNTVGYKLIVGHVNSGENLNPDNDRIFQIAIINGGGTNQRRIYVRNFAGYTETLPTGWTSWECLATNTYSDNNKAEAILSAVTESEAYTDSKFPNSSDFITSLKSNGFVVNGTSAYHTDIRNYNDLNDITEFGNYIKTGTSDHTIENQPSGFTNSTIYKLVVIRTPSSAYFMQIIFHYGSASNYNRIYLRTYRNGTWDPWLKIAFSEYVDSVASSTLNSAKNYTDESLNSALLNSVYSLELNTTIALTDGDDLNDIKTAGNYKFSHASGTSVLNAPVSTAFRLIVGKTVGNSDYTYQILIDNSANERPHIYYRNWTGGSSAVIDGWNEWCAITDRKYVDGKINELKATKNFNKYGVFGIEFRRNNANPNLKRTSNSAGLEYKQQTGSVIDYSDFDNAYPWCEMRECNIEFVSDEPVITYKGETGFSYDNNTFVEIPAFYFKRSVENGVEKWEISGSEFPGAEIEPWFKDGTNIIPYRYIARYEGSVEENYGKSVRNNVPTRYTTKSGFVQACQNSGFEICDIYCYCAIMHLIAIEYGELNTQKINVGISYLPYSMSTSTWNKPETVGITNTVIMPYRLEMTYLNVGDSIYISDESASSNDNRRTITDIQIIEVNNEQKIQITFDGTAYAVSENTRIYPDAQPTGQTDSMTYYNGSAHDNDKVSAFQYRGIENPYGNVWEIVDKINYVYSASGDYEQSSFAIEASVNIAGNSISGGTALGYKPPRVGTTYGNDTAANSANAFIKTLGFDENNKWATLIDENGATLDTYLSDGWDNAGTSKIQSLAVSGGWDHQGQNGIFMLRSIPLITSQGGTFVEAVPGRLYGFRMMY